jgi:hypothetical protein
LTKFQTLAFLEGLSQLSWGWEVVSTLSQEPIPVIFNVPLVLFVISCSVVRAFLWKVLLEESFVGGFRNSEKGSNSSKKLFW